jgi:hypothetical protein
MNRSTLLADHINIPFPPNPMSNYRGFVVAVILSAFIVGAVVGVAQEAYQTFYGHQQSALIQVK